MVDPLCRDGLVGGVAVGCVSVSVFTSSSLWLSSGQSLGRSVQAVWCGAVPTSIQSIDGLRVGCVACLFLLSCADVCSCLVIQ